MLLATLALVLCLGAERSHALLCGDGVLDPLLEECDDGNLAAGDCCSPLCHIEPAGDACRPSSGPCDPAEFCTGQSGGCPNDLQRADGDADAVCDEDDVCPAVSDPAQADADGDRIGDACDVCTTLPSAFVERAKLELGGLGGPDGDEKLKLRGSAVVEPAPPVDPSATGVLIQIVDGMGEPSVDVVIPPGVVDPVTKRGWKGNRSGRSWRYRGGHDPIGGIERAIIKQDPRNDSIVRFVVIGRDGVYRAPGAAPVVLSVALRGASPAPGHCPQIGYGDDDDGGPRCQYVNSGTRLVCR